MENNFVNKQANNKKPPLFGTPTRGKGAGLSFTLATTLGTILLFILMIVMAIFGLMQTGYENTQWYLYFCYIVPPVSSVLIVGCYLRYNKTPIRQAVQAQKCHYKYFILAIVLQIGLLCLSELNGLFVEFLQKFGYKGGDVVLPSIEGFGFVGVFLVVGIMAPVAEEMLFRGVVLDGLKSGFSTLAAVFVCGALFSLYHQNPVQTAYQFCCGVAYALLAIKAGSVLPTIVAHFLNNAYILILYKCNVQALPFGVYLPLMIVSSLCLVGTLAYLFVFDKKPKMEREETEKKSERKNFFIFASVGIFVCVLTWITSLFA